MADYTMRVENPSGYGFVQVDPDSDRIRVGGILGGDADLAVGVNSSSDYYVDFVNAGSGDITGLKLNGTQVDSSILSDVASIGMLDEAETVGAKWTWSGFDGQKLAVQFTANDESTTDVQGFQVTGHAILAGAGGSEQVHVCANGIGAGKHRPEGAEDHGDDHGEDEDRQQDFQQREPTSLYPVSAARRIIHSGACR